MTHIVDRFAHENLTLVNFPKKEQQVKEHWNVSGILKERSNQEFKFDVRAMHTLPNNQVAKTGSTSSKADKMVFESAKEWIIIDIRELHNYLKRQIANGQKDNIIQFEDLVKKAEWNIFIKKVNQDTPSQKGNKR